jgi:hypothetical protein
MYVPEMERDVRKIMATNGHAFDVIWILGDLYPKYDTNDIVLIPHLISDEEMLMSAHVLPLEFVIDIGTQKKPVQDADAEKMRDALISNIPALKEVRFGIWIREMSSNGYKKAENF